jgi:transcriptional regulator with XRE-family HTH domain
MGIKQVFGANVKLFRRRKGFSQEALSEKLDITPNHLSKIERGEAFISAELLEYLVRALEVPAQALFSSAGDPDGDETTARFEYIVNEELRRAAETITRRMRADDRRGS